MISFSLDAAQLQPMSPHGVARLRRLVENSMVRNGRSGRSHSGRSSIMAIEWCQRHGLPFQLSCAADHGGYEVLVPSGVFLAFKANKPQRLT